jgi:ATP adenylyltransferase
MTNPIVEHIWCGWRAEYINDKTSRTPTPDDPRSVFTRLLESGLDDGETMIVHRGETCFALLNNFPYTVGHTLVLPYREVADLEDLTASETAELWATVTDAVRAVKAAYSPNAVNVGINLGKAAGGSIAQHLHVHVVSRWIGDANFMTATSATRTIPEALSVTWQKVAGHWPDNPGQPGLILAPAVASGQHE